MGRSSSSPPVFLLRLLATLRYYGGGLYRRLEREPVPIWAQAVAFKVLTTIVPVILIAMGVFGLVLRQPNPYATISQFLRTFLPVGQSTALLDLLDTLQQTSQTITIVGTVTLIVLVVTLFSILRMVISMAAGRTFHGDRSLLRSYAFDAGMAILVGLMFLLSFSLTVAGSALNAIGVDVLTELGVAPSVLRYGERLLLRGLSFVLPLLLSLAMFALLFYAVPKPRPPGKSVLVGALLTAILFDLAKNAFTLYATYLGRFDRFATSESAVGSVFGLLLAFVVWVYVSGLILIVGAMVMALHEERHRKRTSPTQLPLALSLWNRVRRRSGHRLSSRRLRQTEGPSSAPGGAAAAESAGPTAESVDEEVVTSPGRSENEANERLSRGTEPLTG